MLFTRRAVGERCRYHQRRQEWFTEFLGRPARWRHDERKRKERCGVGGERLTLVPRVGGNGLVVEPESYKALSPGLWGHVRGIE